MFSLAPKSDMRSPSPGRPPVGPPARAVVLRKCAACEDDKLQTKLEISEPGDALEREADAVADKVMRMAVSPAAVVQAPAGPAAAAMPAGAPQSVQQVLRSPGRPLDAGTRAFMEPRFGRDFGGVRIHTGAEAASSARAVNALAYTVGRNIVLGSAPADRKLLAHELAHVVQQSDVPIAGANPVSVQRRAIPGLQRKVVVSPAGSAGEVAGHFNTICGSAGFAAKGDAVEGTCIMSNQGCDCLCDVTSDAARIYTINVKTSAAGTESVTLAGAKAPTTIPKASFTPTTTPAGSNATINLPSVLSNVEFGSFKADGSGEWAPIWRILGHELCGHARQGFGNGGTTGNRPGHDATIDVENAIAGEHGEPPRGHFADPRHGESFLNPIGDRTKVRFGQPDGTHFEAP